MKYHYSKRSLANINSCCEPLIMVAKHAIRYWDTICEEGYRGELEQNKYYKAGTSKVQYPNSKHNKIPSEAIHLAPYNTFIRGIDWNDKELFVKFGFFIIGLGHSLDVKLRWGGDWDMDGNRSDQNFDDLVHFEFVRWL